MTGAELRTSLKSVNAKREAILEKAEQEARGFSAEEKAEFDKLTTEATDTKVKLQSLDERDAARAAVREDTKLVPASEAFLQSSKAIGRSDQVIKSELDVKPSATLSVIERPREKGQTIGTLVRSVILYGRDKEAACDWAAKTWGESSPEYFTLQASDFTAGGVLVPEVLSSEIIELLRPMSVVRAMGPRFINLVTGTELIPRISAGAAASYQGEIDPITPSEETLDGVKLVEKFLTALVPVSNTLLRNAASNVDQMIRDDLARSLATREDQAFIRDNGTVHTPQGLRFQAAAANISASAGTTLANVRTDLRTLINALELSNVVMDGQVWLMSPRTKNYMMWDLTDGNNNLVFQREMATGVLDGKRFFVSTNIPTNLGGGGNESELYLVQPRDVVIGDGMRITLSVSSEATYVENGVTKSAFQRNLTLVRAVSSHDLAVRHPESIAIKTGVTYGA